MPHIRNGRGKGHKEAHGWMTVDGMVADVELLVSSHWHIPKPDRQMY